MIERPLSDLEEVHRRVLKRCIFVALHDSQQLDPPPVDKGLDLAFWKVAVAVPRSPLYSEGLTPTVPAYSSAPQEMRARIESMIRDAQPAA